MAIRFKHYSIIAITVMVFISRLNGQSNAVKLQVDSLDYLKVDSITCNTGLYWRIVAEKDKAIPYLINKLTDTTLTNIYNKCKGGKVTVGDIAYWALDDIMPLPIMDITHIQFDVISDGCWSFYDWLYSNSHKAEFQNDVHKWYEQNKSDLIWRKIPAKELNECQKKYNITGHYKLNK